MAGLCYRAINRGRFAMAKSNGHEGQQTSNQELGLAWQLTMAECK
jgi:hypothetical protein